jgi:glycosyltransferase involved in cell wall biosynthesis
MIDVIIPAYNAHSTLERCLLSIANQTIADKVQVIVVDDKSPDGGYKDIIAKYSHLLKIKEVSMEVNGGPGTARRVGVDNSNNPYMTFIDADDVLIESLFLEGSLDYLERNQECVMVSASFLEEQPDKRLVPHQKDLIWVFGKVYRRENLIRKGINFSDLRSNEDLEFNTKIRLTLSFANNNKEENIYFLEDKFPYIWKYKADSITRKEDDKGLPYEYSFNTGLVGAIDAKLSAYTFNRVNLENIQEEIAAQTIDFYNQFLSVSHDRPDRKDFLENVFNKMVEFYDKMGKKALSKFSKQEISAMFNNRNTRSVSHITPNLTFDTFISFLENKKIDYEKINH